MPSYYAGQTTACNAIFLLLISCSTPEIQLTSLIRTALGPQADLHVSGACI